MNSLISIVIPIIKESNHHKVWMQKRLTEPFLGKLEFPGGKIEFLETPKVAAIREVLEEVGVTLLESDLELFTIIHNKTKSKTIVLNVFLTQNHHDFPCEGFVDLKEFIEASDFSQKIPPPNLKIFEMLQENFLC